MEFIPCSWLQCEIDERIGSWKKKNNDFVLINIYIFPLYFPCIYIVLKILVYIRIYMQKMKSLKIHLVIEKRNIFLFFLFLNVLFIFLILQKFNPEKYFFHSSITVPAILKNKLSVQREMHQWMKTQCRNRNPR